MNQKYKMFFFDVDGTIYEHRFHDFPLSTKKALNQLKANGYKIGIATSRCKDELTHTPAFFREFDFDAIIYDGGAVIEMQKEFVKEIAIPEADLKIIMDYAKEHDLYLRYAGKDFDYFVKEATQAIKDVYFRLYLCVPPVKEYNNEAVTNILLYIDKDQQKELAMKLSHCNFIDHNELFEITALGVNKASAIEHVSQHFDYDLSEIVAFGDGYNDVEMLKTVGLGIAMGNGCQAVKTIAADVCDDISKDGIYHACLKHGFI